jgi:hypothetical protein
VGSCSDIYPSGELGSLHRTPRTLTSPAGVRSACATEG